MNQSSEFETRFDDFLYRYEWAREFGIDGLNTALTGDLTHWLESVLEIDAHRKSAETQALMRSWMVFRMARILGKEAFLQKMVRQTTDDDVAAIYDVFRAGRLGAFRLRRVESNWEVTMLTGSPDEKSLPVAVVTDENFDDFNPTDRVVVGWLLDLDAHPVYSPEAQNRVIIEGTRLAKSSASKLNAVLERQPWGPKNSFRHDDYESDILSLLLDSHVEDTNRCNRRIFLPDIGYWRSGELRMLMLQELPYQIIKIGFPALRDDHISNIATAPRADLCKLTPQRMVALRQDLDTLRNASITYFYEHIDMGPHTLELSLPDRDILRRLGLQPDGTLPVADKLRAIWLDYRLTLLPLGSEWIRCRGLDTTWSIDQGLRWAKNNLDDDDTARLLKAVDHHWSVLRWRTLVGAFSFENPFDIFLPPVSYNELIQGILRLLPIEHSRPVAALPHPQGRSWTSLLRRLNIGPHPEQIAIQDLPPTADEIAARKGFGARSLDILSTALLNFCSGWPESAGHTVATSADDTVTQSLSEGLDELDDLF